MLSPCLECPSQGFPLLLRHREAEGSIQPGLLFSSSRKKRLEKTSQLLSGGLIFQSIKIKEMRKTDMYQPVSLMYLYKAEYVKSNRQKQMG